MNELELTQDQQNAYEAFVQFILDPLRNTFVLEGYAGTGKSTLVNKMLDDIPSILRTLKLIDKKGFTEWNVLLSATTNKAAEALSHITGEDVLTIQSLLGLIVRKDYSTGKTDLVLKPNAEEVTGAIIFIDEASYIDNKLLSYIQKRTPNCKIVFIGDPAQLTAVGSKGAPVFLKGFHGAKLTEVRRQAEGNPIMAATTAFREWVVTGEPTPVHTDGTHLVHLSRKDFDQKVIAEFSRPDWKHNDSKILAWTNKRVVAYNNGLRQLIHGTPNFSAGDYAICNTYVNHRSERIMTDSTVLIESIHPSARFAVPGFTVRLVGYNSEFFLPENFSDKNKTINAARKEDDFGLAETIDRTWIDLRAAYACTINKSQGSTYDKVFIDLDDIKKCASGDQVARMMYVGTSRARSNVYFTGDFA